MTGGAPPVRRPPRLVRLVAWVAAVMVAAWVGAGVLPRYVEACILEELRALGFDDASLRLGRVTFYGLDLSDVRLDPRLHAEEVRVRFHPLDLLVGQIGAVTVTGAVWRTPLDSGSLEASPVARLLSSGGSSDASSGGAAVERVRVVRSRIEIEGEEGVTPIAVEGGVASRPAGTEVTLRATQRRIAAGVGGAEVVLRGARVEARAVLDGLRLADLSIDATAESVSVDGHTAGGLAASGRLAGDRVAFRIDTTGGPLSLSAEGEVPSDPAAWSGPASWPVSWRVEGPLPAWLLPDIEPSSEATVSATCLSTFEREKGGAPRLIVSDLALVAKAVRLAPLGIDAELEGVYAELRARGEVGPGGVYFEVVEPSRVSLASARLEDGVARSLVVAPAVRLEGGSGGFRLTARGDTTVRAESLDVAGRVRLGPLDFTVLPRDRAPLVEHAGGRTRVVAGVRGQALRIRGKVRGRDARIRGELTAALGARGAFVRAPVELDIARLAHPESDLVLGRARVAVPLAFGAGAQEPVASVAARHLSWRGVRLCAATGEVRFGAEAVRVDVRCPFGGEAPATLSALLALGGGGTLDVVVPESTIDAADPVARVLRDLTSLAVSGTIGGDVHLDLGSDRGRTRFAFREASVGGVGLGPGAAVVAFDGDGVVTFEDAVVELGGGRVQAAPFRIDPDDPELDLSLAVHGLKLREVLRTVSDGRASGTGELDGRLAFRMRLEPRLGVEIGDSVLSARGKGRIRIGDAALRESVERSAKSMPYDEQLRRHVTGALTDFEYTELSLAFRKSGAAGRLRASVHGRGKVVPQELRLTLDVNGVQEIVDEVLRLRPSGGLEIAFGEARP